MSGMKSKVAETSKLSLIAGSRRLSRAQRLEAFLVHSRLMTDLYRAGKVHRDQSPPRQSS
jgi:hypothetical protein